jgi:hypothetical protein
VLGLACFINRSDWLAQNARIFIRSVGRARTRATGELDPGKRSCANVADAGTEAKDGWRGLGGDDSWRLNRRAREQMLLLQG